MTLYHNEGDDKIVYEEDEPAKAELSAHTLIENCCIFLRTIACAFLKGSKRSNCDETVGEIVEEIIKISSNSEEGEEGDEKETAEEKKSLRRSTELTKVELDNMHSKNVDDITDTEKKESTENDHLLQVIANVHQEANEKTAVSLGSMEKLQEEESKIKVTKEMSEQYLKRGGKRVLSDMLFEEYILNILDMDSINNQNTMKPYLTPLRFQAMYNEKAFKHLDTTLYTFSQEQIKFARHSYYINNIIFFILTVLLIFFCSLIFSKALKKIILK